MSKCTKCGCNLIGTAANPPADQLFKYCKIDLLRNALVGFVGADGKTELDQMELALRLSAAPDADKALAINAIDALRQTLPT